MIHFQRDINFNVSLVKALKVSSAWLLKESNILRRSELEGSGGGVGGGGAASDSRLEQ